MLHDLSFGLLYGSLIILSLVAAQAAIAWISRLSTVVVVLSRTTGEAIGIAAAWPVECFADRLDRLVARGAEWRTQRRIWRAEFKGTLTWPEFRVHLRGAAQKDEVGHAVDLLGLSHPFTRADLDARFKRVIAGVHPDKGGSVVLARMATDARAVILKNKGWKK